MSRPIVFLSDFGLDDEFVGTCHGVIARISPAVRVIDLTHSIPPRDVVRGALVLAQSTKYMPKDAVFLAVVDPGVGTARRTLAVGTVSGHSLVGPDNGLLSLAWGALGGVTEAGQITSSAVVLARPSDTFHGRDVFAPAAAHLALGMPIQDLGPPIDPQSLIRLDLPRARVSQGQIGTEVLSIDRFGNLQLAARPADLTAAGLEGTVALDVRSGGAIASARRAATFGDVQPGDLALIMDSSGWLALVVNGGSAGQALRLGPGDKVTLSERAR